MSNQNDDAPTPEEIRIAFLLCLKARGWQYAVRPIAETRGGGFIVALIDTLAATPRDRIRLSKRGDDLDILFMELSIAMQKDFPETRFHRKVREEAWREKHWACAILAQFLPVLLSCAAYLLGYIAWGFAPAAALGLVTYLGAVWPCRFFAGTHRARHATLGRPGLKREGS